MDSRLKYRIWLGMGLAGAAGGFFPAIVLVVVVVLLGIEVDEGALGLLTGLFAGSMTGIWAYHKHIFKLDN